MTVTTPIVKTVEVTCSRERAFDTWTDLAGWWPLDTHAVGDAVDVRLEPREGGRIVEIDRDGSEHLWGHVKVFDRPARLVFTFGAWRPETTEVEVRFDADGPRRTVVTLEHRGWEALGDGAGVIRPRYVTGWDVVLARFADRAAAAVNG